MLTQAMSLNHEKVSLDSMWKFVYSSTLGMGRDPCVPVFRQVRSWDEKYLHSATAFHTTAKFQLVNTMDSLQSLRNLPFHKMQSGAATLIRQSGGILDIATAICSRSN